MHVCMLPSAGAYTTLVQLQIQRHEQDDESSSVEVEEAEEHEAQEMLESGQAGHVDGAIELSSQGSGAMKGRASSSLEMARSGSLGQRPPSSTSRRWV